MEFHVFEYYVRNGIGINIIRYVILGITIDTKTNIATIWLGKPEIFLVYCDCNELNLKPVSI